MIRKIGLQLMGFVLCSLSMAQEQAAGDSFVTLDADKEGFLRSHRSLTQTAGRAARNVNGKVIFYADRMTDSMRQTMEETARRREKQLAYNEKHG
ncbi:MAG: hypothetical protein PUF04_08005, partial [bacterium]|nr:hypothetical protein [bacterium]